MHLFYRIHLSNTAQPVDMEEGRHQHNISDLVSLKLASCQNFGFPGILEDQKRDCNIVCCTNNRPYFRKVLAHQK